MHVLIDTDMPLLKAPFPAQRSFSSPGVLNAGVPPRGLSKVSWKVYSDQYLEANYQAAFSDDEDGSTDSLPSGGEEEDVTADGAEGLPDPLTVDVTADSVPSSSSNRYFIFQAIILI